MSTAYESMTGILKLYELRREEKMREARNWFVTFSPESAQDVIGAMRGEHSAKYRMVASYWDMAASFVNHGAIEERMFNDATIEHIAVFAKTEPFLEEIRTITAPQYLANLEQLVMRLPDAKESLAGMRERIKAINAARAEAAAARNSTKSE